VGFIDKTGKWVVEPKFTQAFEFNGGIAQVFIDGKSGYVNTSGKYVWEPSK